MATTRVLRGKTRQLVQYIDQKVIVISKPPGVISQLQAGTRTQDDASGLLFENSIDKIIDDLTLKLNLDTRPVPVHRLDKATTGALLLGRTPDAVKSFSKQFSSREISKTYLALVRGGRETFKTDQGNIIAKLGLDSHGRTQLQKDGTETSTTWELLASSPLAPISLLRLKLHTGFKHQLRVHLARILGAPILGDSLHSQSKISEKILEVAKIPEDRLFLHSSNISFSRYRKATPRRYTVGVTAPLPKDFVQLCNAFGFKPDPEELHGVVTVNREPAPYNQTDFETWYTHWRSGVNEWHSSKTET
ncbi:hypothetical protein M422DRAFT_214678 [Sphaerobolus stellatus SS14]|uniref:21S rRNA pseudouridine(2819) synthase n=1 Tax=Sphaerobolus stellatus (strain SS14) TaxID=990650 RepID=A0A0C9UYG4_SPHS4|nr:hypothetical protein M422DRAFT_214678 [Sphaerobolus stellatus SS14]